MTTRQNIAQNLLFYRKKNNLTQRQLAEKLNVKNSSVSNWEQGLNSIDIDTLHLVCEVFDITLNQICGFSSISETINYSSVEVSIINTYRSLNTDGQNKARDYMDDLSSNPKYLKTSINPAYTEKEKPTDIKTPSRPLIAARSGGVKPATDKQMKDLELFAINYEKEKNKYKNRK